MAFLTNVTAGAMLTGLVGIRVAGFAGMIVGGLQAATAAYASQIAKRDSSIVKRVETLEGDNH